MIGGTAFAFLIYFEKDLKMKVNFSDVGCSAMCKILPNGVKWSFFSGKIY
jgi:hypothetical protein